MWHVSPTISSDIYYGTFMDDDNGNVAIGLDSPLAKLHVKGHFRVDTSGSIIYPNGSTSPAADTALIATGARV